MGEVVGEVVGDVREALTRGAAILGNVMPLVAMLSALVLAAPLPADVGLGVPVPGPQPIIGGDPVALSDWPSVVALVGIDGGFTSNTAELCTAVLIDPQTVLTAGHCLEDAEGFEQILVIFGDTIYTTDGNRRTTGVDFGVHPSYCLGECDEDVYDFGYVVLGEPVQGVPTIPPLVDQGEWDELMVENHELLLVGFGAARDTSDEDASALSMDEVGHKRSVTTVLNSLSSTGLELFAGQEGRDTCNGDSGGPVFAQLANGEWRLVGITSRGVTPCGSGRGIYGVPYAALPWIAEETGIELLPANCAEADCLDIAPSKKDEGRCSAVSAEESRAPSLFGLGLLGLVVVGRRRRRRS